MMSFPRARWAGFAVAASAFAVGPLANQTYGHGHGRIMVMPIGNGGFVTGGTVVGSGGTVVGSGSSTIIVGNGTSGTITSTGGSGTITPSSPFLAPGGTIFLAPSFSQPVLGQAPLAPSSGTMAPAASSLLDRSGVISNLIREMNRFPNDNSRQNLRQWLQHTARLYQQNGLVQANVDANEAVERALDSRFGAETTTVPPGGGEFRPEVPALNPGADDNRTYRLRQNADGTITLIPVAMAAPPRDADAVKPMSPPPADAATEDTPLPPPAEDAPDVDPAVPAGDSPEPL